MDDYIEPVVQERPMRGREMKTNIVPTDMFDTMKVISEKKTLTKQTLVPDLEAKSEKTAELYHEGYVDGKLYLVPDSNLEAMKDMINFKMKPRRSSRYKHQTSFQLTDYDHFRGKLHTLMEKIEEIESESEEEVEEEEEEEEEKEEEKVQEEEKKQEEEKVEEEEVVEEEEKEEPSPQPMRPLDPNRLRFLISGHFQKDKNPIYIIQDYRGGPDLFREQKADFYNKQKEDDVDLTIAGRFYDKIILEESHGKPKALNIEPYRILIDEKSSNVYNEYFEQVYKFNSADISLKGEFIKSKITKRTTPFLTIDVKHKHPAEPNIRSEREDSYHRNPSTAVLVYKPEYDNPFAKGDENYFAYPVFNNQEINSNALVFQSSIGVLTSNLKNNDDQISSGSADENMAVDETYHVQDINEYDLKTIVSVKPFDITTRNKLANMAEHNDINISHKSSYTKDLEQLDCNIYNGKKLKKKRKSKKRRNSVSASSTTGSNSFPTLQEKKVKPKEGTI